MLRYPVAQSYRGPMKTLPLILSVLVAAVSAYSQDPKAPAIPNLTGPIDEAAFKALHELKGEKAPPLKGAMIELGQEKAYLSLPKDGKTPLPAVILIHEWWGLNDHVKHWADRLAAEGYAALAVDLYGGVVATTADQAMEAMKKVDAAKSLTTMQAAYARLAEDPRILAKKRATMGWCFGGTQSLKFAIAEPTLNAAVIYYGRLTAESEDLAKIKAKVCGVFGTKDRSIPNPSVDDFENTLKANEIENEIYRYDAEHAFANPSNPRYDTKCAGEAWEKVKAFLAKALKG